MLSKMNLISVVQQLPKEDIETIQGYVEMIEEENQALKKQLENYKKLGFKHLQDKNNNLETQQKEFIKWLEDEKDILAKGCSDICKDKFEEVDDILQQYKKIIGE